MVVGLLLNSIKETNISFPTKAKIFKDKYYIIRSIRAMYNCTFIVL